MNSYGDDKGVIYLCFAALIILILVMHHFPELGNLTLRSIITGQTIKP